MKNKKIRLTEDQFYNAVTRMVLEYIGDNGMLGKEYLDDGDFPGDDLDFNTQPSNELADDDEYHDATTVGDGEIDPSYYEDFDPLNYDNHELTDNELYNYGNW